MTTSPSNPPTAPGTSRTSTDENVWLEVDPIGPKEQVLVYFSGDGMPLVFEDSDNTLTEIVSYLNPIERAVLIARLRGYADLVENAPQSDR